MTEFTIRATPIKGKPSFTTYRSKDAAQDTFHRSKHFHTEKNDGVVVELFKVVRYGASVHHIEKIG